MSGSRRKQFDVVGCRRLASALTGIVLLWLALGGSDRANAQVLTNWSFDLVLQGDDPGELFRLELPGNAALPSVVRFEGAFENLDAFETGVRYGLSWGLESADLGGF